MQIILLHQAAFLTVRGEEERAFLSSFLSLPGSGRKRDPARMVVPLEKREREREREKEGGFPALPTFCVRFPDMLLGERSAGCKGTSIEEEKREGRKQSSQNQLELPVHFRVRNYCVENNYAVILRMRQL